MKTFLPEFLYLQPLTLCASPPKNKNQNKYLGNQWCSVLDHKISLSHSPSLVPGNQVTAGKSSSLGFLISNTRTAVWCHCPQSLSCCRGRWAPCWPMVKAELLSSVFQLWFVGDFLGTWQYLVLAIDWGMCIHRRLHPLQMLLLLWVLDWHGSLLWGDLIGAWEKHSKLETIKIAVKVRFSLFPLLLWKLKWENMTQCGAQAWWVWLYSNPEHLGASCVWKITGEGVLMFSPKRFMF